MNIKQEKTPVAKQKNRISPVEKREMQPGKDRQIYIKWMSEENNKKKEAHNRAKMSLKHLTDTIKAYKREMRTVNIDQ